MLYNPDWKQPPADIFALESLIAWLERQPGGREYCYLDNGECLLGQYFQAQGYKKVWVGAWTCELSGEKHIIPDNVGKIAFNLPRTFGGALLRARAALAARDV